MVQLQRYLELDGVEVINGKRLSAYLQGNLAPAWEDPPCPVEQRYLLSSVPDGSYSDPVTDPAPWVDGRESSAEHFFGIAVRSFTCDLGPIERVNSSPRRLGRLQTRTRRFTLIADLIADDCCGTDYGRRWLLARFGVGCGNACTTQQSLVAVCGDGGDSGEDAPTLGPWRTSYRVGLVSFEDLSEEAGLECCFGMRARIVFDAEDPWFYGQALPVYDALEWGASLDSGECVTFTACPEPDPAPCLGTVVPSIAPPPLPSVAGPSAPGGTNVPWCEPLFQAHQCGVVDLAPWGVSTFSQAALRFTITAGSADMLNARIRVYALDSPEDACDSPADFGTALSELDITFVPAGGTLVVDGAAHTIQLYCPDTASWINAEHLVYGPTGAFWRHPLVGCEQQYLCVCASVDSEATAVDATFQVEAIPRFL